MTKPIQRLLHIVKRFQYVLHTVFVLRMRRGHAIEPGLLQSRKCYDPETDWRIVLVKVVVDDMSGSGRSSAGETPILLGRTCIDLILLEVMRNLCNKSGEFIPI
jgi:hypothetical protein